MPYDALGNAYRLNTIPLKGAKEKGLFIMVINSGYSSLSVISSPLIIQRNFCSALAGERALVYFCPFP